MDSPAAANSGCDFRNLSATLVKYPIGLLVSNPAAARRLSGRSRAAMSSSQPFDGERGFDFKKRLSPRLLIDFTLSERPKKSHSFGAVVKAPYTQVQFPKLRASNSLSSMESGSMPGEKFLKPVND